MRLADSLETALKLGEGFVTIQIVDGDEMTLSERLACKNGHVSLANLEPRVFSFNTPHGACTDCNGLGSKLELDPALIIPNRSLAIGQGAIVPWVKAHTRETSLTRHVIEAWPVSTGSAPTRRSIGWTQPSWTFCSTARPASRWSCSTPTPPDAAAPTSSSSKA